MVGSVFDRERSWWTRRASALGEGGRSKHWSERRRRERSAQRVSRPESARASMLFESFSTAILAKCLDPEPETVLKPSRAGLARITLRSSRSLRSRCGACGSVLRPAPSPFGSPPGTFVGRPPSTTRLPSRLPRSARSLRSLVSLTRPSRGAVRPQAGSQRAPAGPTGESVPPVDDRHRPTTPRHPIPHETGVSR